MCNLFMAKKFFYKQAIYVGGPYVAHPLKRTLQTRVSEKGRYRFFQATLVGENNQQRGQLGNFEVGSFAVLFYLFLQAIKYSDTRLKLNKGLPKQAITIKWRYLIKGGRLLYKLLQKGDYENKFRNLLYRHTKPKAYIKHLG